MEENRLLVKDDKGLKHDVNDVLIDSRTAIYALRAIDFWNIRDMICIAARERVVGV